MENNLDIMTRLDYLVSGIDTVWVLLAAILIFMMQMGFASVEAGFTRSKNTANILMKNLLDFCFGSLLFWLFGFRIMFGADAFAGRSLIRTRPASHASLATVRRLISLETFKNLSNLINLSLVHHIL